MSEFLSCIYPVDYKFTRSDQDDMTIARGMSWFRIVRWLDFCFEIGMKKCREQKEEEHDIVNTICSDTWSAVGISFEVWPFAFARKKKERQEQRWDDKWRLT